MLRKRNILIVENEEWQHKIIAKFTEENLNKVCNIYPQLGGSELNNWEDLIIEINLKNFTNVLGYYKYIDIFLIDIHLYNNEDTLGVDLAQEILRNKTGNYKIILISNNPGENDKLLDNEKVISFVKDGAAQVWAKELVDLIANEILKLLVAEISATNS